MNIVSPEHVLDHLIEAVCRSIRHKFNTALYLFDRAALRFSIDNRVERQMIGRFIYNSI